MFREPSATEAIYIATATQVVSRSTVRGRIDAASLRRALDRLEASRPVLRSVVLSGSFVEKPATTPPPLIWHDLGTIPAEALYAELFDTPLDLAVSVYAVHAVETTDGFELFLLTSHAIADATALIELHGLLIHLCDGVLGGRVPDLPEQPFPDSIDRAVELCLASLGTPAPAARPAPASAGFLQIPSSGTAIQPGFRHRLERFVLEPDLLPSVVAAAHRQGVSVHAWLVAAYARAIRDLAGTPSGPMLMRSSIDMRRRLEPHLSTETVVSAITGHVTRIDEVDAPLAVLAKAIFDDIHGGAADGRLLHDYLNYPKAFGDPHDAPIALNISDMGTVRFRFDYERLTPTGFEYATGWRKTYPNLSVTIFEGRLVANAVYIAERTAPATMASLSAGVIDELRRSAEAEG